MEESGPEEQLDIAMELAAIDERLLLVRRALANRLGVFLEDGVTEPEAAELEGVRDMLGRISAEAHEQYSVIVIGALPVREFFIAPDPTLDEDEKFDIAKRFVKSKIGEPFRLLDVEERLVKRGVILPDDRLEKASLLEGWLAEIHELVQEELKKDIRRVEYTRDGEKFVAFAPVGHVSSPEDETTNMPPVKDGLKTRSDRADNTTTSHKRPAKVEAKVLPSEEEQKHMMSIVEILAKSKDANMYLKAPEVSMHAVALGYDKTDFRTSLNRHMRLLEKQGIVDRISGRRRESKPGFRLSTPKLRELMRTPDGKKYIAGLIASAEHFEGPGQ